MIVKIRTAEGDGWVFVGDLEVVEVVEYRMVGPETNDPNDPLPKAVASYEVMEIAPVADKVGGRNTILIGTTPDGRDKRLMFNTDAYLLNNHGVTIERI